MSNLQSNQPYQEENRNGGLIAGAAIGTVALGAGAYLFSRGRAKPPIKGSSKAATASPKSEQAPASDIKTSGASERTRPNSPDIEAKVEEKMRHFEAMGKETPASPPKKPDSLDEWKKKQQQEELLNQKKLEQLKKQQELEAKQQQELRAKRQREEQLQQEKEAKLKEERLKKEEAKKEPNLVGGYNTNYYNDKHFNGYVHEKNVANRSRIQGRENPKNIQKSDDMYKDRDYAENMAEHLGGDPEELVPFIHGGNSEMMKAFMAKKHGYNAMVDMPNHAEKFVSSDGIMVHNKVADRARNYAHDSMPYDQNNFGHKAVLMGKIPRKHMYHHDGDEFSIPPWHGDKVQDFKILDTTKMSNEQVVDFYNKNYLS